MKRTREDILADLLKSQIRQIDIEYRGTAALSRYDVEIAYGGDHKKAVSESLWLVGNHISYYRRELAEMDKIPQQRKLL